ncbi:MAG: SDR family NAD(P)-dependent oxidoreductase [Tepidisphaerales bacterium]
MSKPVCIVTGAGRGIGRETVVQLVKRGYNVVGASRTAEELAATSRQARGCVCVPTDVADSKQVDRLVDETVKRFGRVDAAVNCAGMAPFLRVDEMTDAQWHQIIDTNLSSAFYLARAVWPVMKKQGGGVLVNISSLSARDPFEKFGAYAAAKAGLNMLGWVAAREGEAAGIRVHTVAPGAVETGMFRALLGEKDWPRAKCLDPADVAKMIVMCVTGEMKHTTGEVIWMREKFE